MAETPPPTRYTEPLQREPWRSAPAFAVQLLRHRLALHSVAEIADHYHMTETGVRLQYMRLAQYLRGVSPLPIRGQVEMLILAERDGLPLLQLAAAETNVSRSDP